MESSIGINLIKSGNVYPYLTDKIRAMHLMPTKTLIFVVLVIKLKVYTDIIWR